MRVGTPNKIRRGMAMGEKETKLNRPVVPTANRPVIR
jgi:hypothetical protein